MIVPHNELHVRPKGVQDARLLSRLRKLNLAEICVALGFGFAVLKFGHAACWHIYVPCGTLHSRHGEGLVGAYLNPL